MLFTASITLSLIAAGLANDEFVCRYCANCMLSPSQVSNTANSGVCFLADASGQVSGNAACRRRFLVVGEVAVARSLVAFEA